jgi:signal transduction histidine kinase
VTITAADIRRIDLFEELDDAALEELATHTDERLLEAGEILVDVDEPSTCFFLLFQGELESWRPPAPGEPGELEKLHVAPTYAGAIPLLTERPWMVMFRAHTPIRVGLLSGEMFRRTLHAHRSVERTVMRTFQPVMQRVEAATRQREKLAALGTIAAGLAHELNNPAAAARRTAADLAAALETVQNTLSLFVESGVERDRAQELVNLQREAIRRSAEATAIDQLTASEREEELSERLEGLGIAEPWTLAEPLVAAGLDARWFEQVAEFAGPAQEAALRWVAASLTAQGLADDLRESTARISELVSAVKEYAYMDQAGEQEVDVHEGIESTLKILGHKLKQGSVELSREYSDSLPRIEVHGSELNQVWTNLLDNAIDALDGEGKLTIRTALSNGQIEVEIIDNGPGIPADVRERIFDPFFTTKEVGKGTGLGLQTARRIVVERHGGDLTLDSDERGTTARVLLPPNAAVRLNPTVR